MVGIRSLQHYLLTTSEKYKINPAQVNENTLFILCAMRTSHVDSTHLSLPHHCMVFSPSKDFLYQCQSLLDVSLVMCSDCHQLLIYQLSKQQKNNLSLSPNYWCGDVLLEISTDTLQDGLLASSNLYPEES